MDSPGDMAMAGYEKWTVTMKGSYVRGNKRRKYTFVNRNDKEKHSYSFHGMPDEADDFYAAKGEKADQDFIRICRETISKDPDIIKCVGSLDQYKDEHTIFIYHKKDGAWPAGLYEVKRYRLHG